MSKGQVSALNLNDKKTITNARVRFLERAFVCGCWRRLRLLLFAAVGLAFAVEVPFAAKPYVGNVLEKTAIGTTSYTRTAITVTVM